VRWGYHIAFISLFLFPSSLCVCLCQWISRSASSHNHHHRRTLRLRLLHLLHLRAHPYRRLRHCRNGSRRNRYRFLLRRRNLPLRVRRSVFGIPRRRVGVSKNRSIGIKFGKTERRTPSSFPSSNASRLIVPFFPFPFPPSPVIRLFLFNPAGEK